MKMRDKYIHFLLDVFFFSSRRRGLFFNVCILIFWQKDLTNAYGQYVQKYFLHIFLLFRDLDLSYAAVLSKRVYPPTKNEK
jgi:hypothetical protein